MMFERAALPALLTFSLSTATLGAGSLASSARAAPGADAAERTAAQMEALAGLGTEAVAAGEHRRAIGYFLDAYRLAPEAGSTLIYNVAYVYDEHLGELETAQTYYRRFIGAAGADPGLLAEADRRLQAIGERLAARVEAPAPPEVPPEVVADPAPPPSEAPRPSPSPRAAPMPVSVAQTVEPPSTVAPWALTITGGVVALTGATLAMLASGEHETFETSADPRAQRDARDAGRVYALGADIGVAVGGAMLVGGVVWLLLTDDDPHVTAVRPTPAGLSVAF